MKVSLTFFAIIAILGVAFAAVLDLESISASTMSLTTPGSNLLDVTTSSDDKGNVGIVTRSDSLHSVISVVSKNSFHKCEVPASAGISTLRAPRKGFYDNHFIVTDNQEIFVYDLTQKADTLTATSIVRKARGLVSELVLVEKTLVVASTWREPGPKTIPTVHLESFEFSDNTFKSKKVIDTGLPMLDDIMMTLNGDKVEVGVIVDNDIKYFEVGSSKVQKTVSIRDVMLYRVAGHYQNNLLALYFKHDHVYGEDAMGLVTASGSVSEFVGYDNVIDVSVPANGTDALALVARDGQNVKLGVFEYGREYPNLDSSRQLRQHMLSLSNFSTVNVHLAPTVDKKNEGASKPSVNSSVAVVSNDIYSAKVIIEFLEFSRSGSNDGAASKKHGPMLTLLVIIGVILIAIVLLLIFTRQKTGGNKYTSV